MAFGISINNTLRRRRSFFGILENDADVVRALQNFCAARGILGAVISGHGLLTDALLGAFDAKQRVFATGIATGTREIASLTGNVFPLDGKPFVALWAVLVNDKGDIAAGRVFSPSRVENLEFFLTELSPSRFARSQEIAMAFHPLVCQRLKTRPEPGPAAARKTLRTKASRMNRTRRNVWKSV